MLDEDAWQYGNEDILHLPKKDLLGLKPRFFNERLSSESVERIFKACDALWMHDGREKSPHAITTKGKHTDGYVNLSKVLCHTNLNFLFAQEMVKQFKRMTPDRPDWVVGSDHAAATLSFAVACDLEAKHDFTEKGPNKTQVWKRHQLMPETKILRVEELITTASTVEAVLAGIEEGNDAPVEFIPFILSVVNRSGMQEINGAKILSLIEFDIQTWEPDACELCDKGSEALRPKGNWERLTKA